MHERPLGRVATVLIAAGCAAIAAPAQAQTHAETERAVRAVADRALQSATFDFVDSATGRHYAAADSAPAGARLRIGSPYNDWRYWNGVLNQAMGPLAGQLEDARYFGFAGRNVAFAFDNAAYFERRHQREDKWAYPFGQLFTMEELDDYGAEGAIVTDMLIFHQDERWTRYVERAADYLATKQSRLPDGTLARSFPRRWTVWADDLFMSVEFLVRLYGRTGEERWLDDATRQVVSFHRYLFDGPAGLMRHNWYSDSGGRTGVAFWGRANGWALMAEVDLLDRLMPVDRARDTVLALFRRHVAGIARYQDSTGLWHQLLDKPDAYLETSASAMFTYAIAKGVRQRYLAPDLAAVARRGWKAVMARIRPDGQIEGTCAGTGVSDRLADYYARPTPLNDPHGIGAVLLAGGEMLRVLR